LIRIDLKQLPQTWPPSLIEEHVINSDKTSDQMASFHPPTNYPATAITKVPFLCVILYSLARWRSFSSEDTVLEGEKQQISRYM